MLAVDPTMGNTVFEVKDRLRVAAGENRGINGEAGGRTALARALPGLRGPGDRLAIVIAIAHGNHGGIETPPG